jgi:hypothetical protein
VTLAIFVSGYWGVHRTIYGIDGSEDARAETISTHGPDPENPHEASVPADAPAEVDPVPQPATEAGPNLDLDDR